MNLLLLYTDVVSKKGTVSFSLTTNGFLLTFMTGPEEFVLDCLERRKIALGSNSLGITSHAKYLFSVVTFTNNLSECYKIYFGNEHETSKRVNF